MDLYLSLLNRLRADAAGAISKLLTMRGEPSIHLEGIQVFVYPGPVTEPIRYCARIRGRIQTSLRSYAGEPCSNEVEALCSLIERAHADLAAAGGSGLPFHLLDQLEDDARVLAVYRREIPILLATARGTSEALDAVAELR
jgi:hypothetical protein